MRKYRRGLDPWRDAEREWRDAIREAADREHAAERDDLLQRYAAEDIGKALASLGRSLATPKRRRARTKEEIELFDLLHPDVLARRARKGRERAEERQRLRDGVRGRRWGSRQYPDMDEEGHEFLETYDPTILRGQVRTERVAAVPSPLRGIVLSIMRQVGAAAVEWDRLQVAMHPGLAIRALERDDYEAIAADAMVARLPKLAADKPPGPYLRTVATNAIRRARERKAAARPLGLVEIPTRLVATEKGTRERPVPILLEDLEAADDEHASLVDERQLEHEHGALDDILELRRLALTDQARRLLARLQDGRSLPEISDLDGIPLRTLEREARRLRAALAASGLPWPLPEPAQFIDLEEYTVH